MKLPSRDATQLPPVICGPILRKLTPGQLVLWWVSPTPLTGRFQCFQNNSDQPFFELTLGPETIQVMKIADRAWVHLLDVQFDRPLEEGAKVAYSIVPHQGDPLESLLPHLTYRGERRPSFMLKIRLDTIFHGSCRNPHHDSKDAFQGADRIVGGRLDMENRPALLMLTGDQIYADDVAGPMLHAIHQVIDLLGFPDEEFQEAVVGGSRELYTSAETYYHRKEILPNTRVGRKWYTRGGVYPVFTSFSSHNHLITFAEYTAMYLLVWSPVLWEYVTLDETAVASDLRTAYRDELRRIEAFVRAIPAAARVMAHLPVYMMFDDHDITDDWNMTAQWEAAAYGHPFSKQIIANGMAAYWLCQGWGNAPENFDPGFVSAAAGFCEAASGQPRKEFTERLFKFEDWEFQLPTSPKLVVVDSRTRRWRSETRAANPSGLMDWEALMELQQQLMGEEAVILVAPAPVFGVKLIEIIQNIVSFFGYPLAVDAENWMAHRGCAHTMLHIMSHVKTPVNYVILSGDVHYSFAYDIVIRFRKNSPRIWQITSSGIKNEFPRPLLRWLDRFNQWLYGPYSPLNLFTKRRRMRIRQRVPVGREHRRLIPDSGVGMVELDQTGRPVRISDVYAKGASLVFAPTKDSERMFSDMPDS